MKSLLVISLLIFSMISLGSGQWNIEMITPDPLYGIKNYVVVAVIDTGLDITHPDFAGKIWINEGEIPNNGIDDDKNGYIDDVNGWDFQNNDNDIQDDNYEYHGTHVSGIIVSDSAGVSPNATIMPLKAMDENGYADFPIIAEAVRYAVDNGADILSMSLGGTEIDSSMSSAIQYAKNNGVLMVAASGNEGASIVHFPAQMEGVIAVGSVNDQKQKSSFSNFGSSMDFVAPGEVIRSTVKTDEGLESVLVVGNTSIGSIPMQFSNKTNDQFEFSLVDGLNGYSTQIPSSANGSMVLIKRGDLPFNEMANNVKLKGGIGIIVYNNLLTKFAGTLQSALNIFAITIDYDDGFDLKLNIAYSSIPIQMNITSSNYGYNSGTSMAVPHVAGIISLMMMKNPLISNEIIERVLIHSTEDLGTPGHDSVFGHGLINGSRINDIMNDVTKPRIEYNIWDIKRDNSGVIKFELNISLTDDIFLYRLEYEYLENGKNKYGEIINRGIGDLTVSLGFELTTTQDTSEIIVRGEDVAGNIREILVVFSRDNVDLDTSDLSKLDSRSSDTLTLIESRVDRTTKEELGVGRQFIFMGFFLLTFSILTRIMKDRRKDKYNQ